MTQKPKDREASRLAWVFMVAMPAFVLGAAVMFAALWLGPVAVRDKVIAEYEADVMRLARELDAQQERPKASE
jgi:lipopolysaccharide export LptBFGC system permease protein LptF